MDHAATPVTLPRGLIFLSFLWLVASWSASIGVRPPVFPSAASYEPGVKRMLLGVVIGLMVAWPLYRLSQPRSLAPIRQTLLDLTVMLSMTQVVIWPLRLITSWTRERTAAMDLTIIAWTLLAGALVASTLGAKPGRVRVLGMLGCLGLCLAGPLAAWLGLQFRVEALDLIDLSPLLSINTLGDGKSAPITPAQWASITWLWVAAVAAWIALALTRRPQSLAASGGVAA